MKSKRYDFHFHSIWPFLSSGIVFQQTARAPSRRPPAPFIVKAEFSAPGFDCLGFPSGFNYDLSVGSARAQGRLPMERIGSHEIGA